MKRSAAPFAVLLALAAAAASAQEFAGMDDLGGRLAAIRGAAAQLALIPQAPVEAAAIPDVSAYQIRGIDVSHYQHAIDWAQVRTAGLSFVYMKATEGVDGVDETFATNWAGARSAGLRRGAYHLYNFCKGGAAQAAQFIKTVPAELDAMPPTLDLEESGSCRTMPSKAAFRKSLAAFVAKVQAAYGRPPIVYVNAKIYGMYFEGEHDAYKVWIADIKHAAPAVSGWTLWQYGWTGSVAGITGDVDLDVFNGTPEMFAALTDDGGMMVADVGPR